ncbi:uncharacterized protein LOC124293418 [Neodiprion lecontei]|uniref:Uncharacterized protein LOC124293418 n=1 Tax=Neodiprion lecontei TaxID=441921 RepID=A0ABM3FQC2_NEOLC|nr:uncharacterized protein LOC124293418 [Neodiprion lecontei]
MLHTPIWLLLACSSLSLAYFDVSVINGTLLQEEVGKVYMYQERWKIFQSIDASGFTKPLLDIHDKLGGLQTIRDTDLDHWNPGQRSLAQSALDALDLEFARASSHKNILEVILDLGAPILQMTRRPSKLRESQSHGTKTSTPKALASSDVTYEASREAEAVFGKHVLLTGLANEMYPLRKSYLTPNIRPKRGMFNFLGTIQKSIYGTADADDLEIINGNLASLKNVTDTLNLVVTKSLHINQVQINILNTNQLKLKHSLETVWGQLESLKIKGNETLAYQEYMEAITLSLFEIKELQRLIDLVMTAVQLGRHGIIDNTLFTPKELMTALQAFDANDKKTLIPIKEENYEKFIKISDLTITTDKGKLIYILTVPYLEKEPWVIIQNTPVPVRINHTYVTLNPTYALKLVRKNFIREVTFSQLKQITDYFIGDYRDVGHRNDTIELCEKITDPIPRRCTLSRFLVTDIAYIRTQGSQIILPSKPIEVTITCASMQTFIIQITKPSLITTNQSCELQTLKTRVKLIVEHMTSQLTEIHADTISPLNKFVTGREIVLHHVINLDTLKDQGQAILDLESVLANNEATLRVNNTWANFKGIGIPSIAAVSGTISVLSILLLLWKFNIPTYISAFAGYCCQRNPSALEVVERRKLKRRIETQAKSNERILREIRSRRDAPLSSSGDVMELEHF